MFQGYDMRFIASLLSQRSDGCSHALLVFTRPPEKIGSKQLRVVGGRAMAVTSLAVVQDWSKYLSDATRGTTDLCPPQASLHDA